MTIQLLLGPNGLMHSSEDESGNVTIFWGGKIYYSFNRNNLFAKKLGIAMLAGLGVLQKTICELFHVSRHTIANIVKFYEEQGIEGLQSYKPGPTSTCEELKQYVVKKYIELAVTYAMLNAGEIAKVDQDFKLLPSYEMGGIIGRVKLPSLSLYRKRIPTITAQLDMRDVILETSKSMHELLCFSDVVYIDGHFMAYHGKSNILYGYNPQKRLAMHGREYFFVHDRNGLPVYATISDGYRKSKHYIEDVDKKLRYIYGVKKKELLEVFDRGGYSKEFCVEISDTIRFICWRSDAGSLPKGIGTDDWTEVNIKHQGNNYGQVDEKTFYAGERKAEFKVEKKKAEFREIWISKGRQASPALSNDFGTSLEDLVRHMTRRWGAQENMFKELKDHGIDRIHTFFY